MQRFLVWLSLVLCFVFWLSDSARAETISATSSGTYSWSHGEFSGTLLSVANGWCAANLGSYLPSGSNGRGAISNESVGQFYCQATMWDGSTANYAVYRTATKGDEIFTCPTSQNWTLSGQVCTRPDCPSYMPRDSNGVCACPSGKSDNGSACVTSCPVGFHNRVPDNGQCEKDCIGDQQQASDGSCKCNAGVKGVYGQQYGSGLSNPGCANGCQVQIASMQICPGGIGAALGVTSVASVNCYGYGTSTGATCGANTNVTVTPVTLKPSAPSDSSGTGSDGATKDPQNTPDNNKDPVTCGASGGSYAVINGVGKCLSSAGNTTDAPAKVTTDKKTATTTNPDGSKVETTTTTTSFQDPKTGETITQRSSTTVTKDAAGNVTGTGTSTTQSSGSGDKSGSEPGQCAKEPDSPLCKKGVLKEKGAFNPQTEQVEAAKAELRALFASVKAQASSMFSGSMQSGAGSLPCWAPITVLGRSFSMCISQYSNQLAILGSYVILAAGLLAAFIIFRR